MQEIVIQTGVIDQHALQQNFQREAEKHNCGAVLSFAGIARADQIASERVQGIVLEHYPGMTERALEQIMAKAFEKWPIKSCTVVHRVGEIAVGETIVVLLVAAVHRKAAINALDFIMDFLKNDVPLWKKEHTPTQGHWVEQKNSDKQAKSLW